MVSLAKHGSRLSQQLTVLVASVSFSSLFYRNFKLALLKNGASCVADTSAQKRERREIDFRFQISDIANLRQFQYRPYTLSVFLFSSPAKCIACPPFTIRHSPFVTRHSPLTIHHAPFTIHHLCPSSTTHGRREQPSITSACAERR